MILPKANKKIEKEISFILKQTKMLRHFSEKAQNFKT